MLVSVSNLDGLNAENPSKKRMDFHFRIVALFSCDEVRSAGAVFTFPETDLLLLTQTVCTTIRYFVFGRMFHDSLMCRMEPELWVLVLCVSYMTLKAIFCRGVLNLRCDNPPFIAAFQFQCFPVWGILPRLHSSLIDGAPNGLRQHRR